MKMKVKISIEEFDNKKFKIRFVEEDDNRKAVLTHYLHNYRNGVKNIMREKLPDDFDILCAGFPCQAFSLQSLTQKLLN